MGFSVDENYHDRTWLGDYYPIIRKNIRNIADFINTQQTQINMLDDNVTNINDTVLPQKISDIESNTNDIGRLTQFADIIIESKSEGISEKMMFRNAIPGVQYCVFAGDTPLTETTMDMAEPTVADSGIFETENIKIKFYADDGCELMESSLDVMTIAGIKTAFLIS